MRAFGIFRAAVLGLLIARAASAYVIDQDGNGHPLHWKSMAVGYRMVSGNAPGGTAAEDAVKRSFQTWDDSSSNVAFAFQGYVSGGNSGYDRQNLVYWAYDNWPFDSNALAVTARYFSRSDGSLLDADIVFNAERYTWSTAGVGYDIQNAATHEVGHFSGLGHSTRSDATMHSSALPGETQKRTLASDDRAGLDALYGGATDGGGDLPNPSSGDAPNTGGVSSRPNGISGGGSGGGGCAIGNSRGGEPSELVWLGALLAGLLLRRRAKIVRVVRRARSPHDPVSALLTR